MSSPFQMVKETENDPSTEKAQAPHQPPLQRRTLRVSDRKRQQIAQQAKLEREWHLELKSNSFFNNGISGIESIRNERIVNAVDSNLGNDTGYSAVDLGCGRGHLSKAIKSLKKISTLVATDGARNVVKLHQEDPTVDFEVQHQILPETKLPDQSFDVVLCCDMITELEQQDHRLLISEVARLVSKNGIVVFSAELDTNTVGAADRLEALLRTELIIKETIFSYHSFTSKIEKLFKWKSDYQSLCLLLEKVCKILRKEPSHVIFVGERRPLNMHDPFK